MLANIIRFSIRYYGVVISLAVLILLYGGYCFSHAGLDIFPEFSPKRVIIQTESPGYSSEQVEVAISQPIEKVLGGLTGLEKLRSESIQGLSVITATFAENSNVYLNRQLVSERLSALATQLPNGIAPVVVPLSSSSATVLTLGLQSDNQSMLALRNLVETTLMPRLLAIPGVADVNVFGGDVQQLQIQVHTDQLRRFNLSLDDIITTATQAGKIQGAGFIENDNQRFTLQMTGQPTTQEQFTKLIVKREQRHNITLGEVANVSFAAQPAIGAAQILGKSGIVLMVIGQYGTNTLTVSKLVEQALEELTPIFKQQSINFYPHLFRPADYIESSLSHLTAHLLLGGFFVLIVLYGFLFNLRTAIISSLAIPVSLCAAVIVLLASGNSLNVMVLGGLGIALGEVVDDAVIDTENIFRRLRENHLLAKPLPIIDVVFNASLEVRGSVVYASFIVALVFVPLITLSGVAGRLFAPLGYSYILAILMSLLVALTLTPALCYALLGSRFDKPSESPLIHWLKPWYQQSLVFVMSHFKKLMVGCGACCLVALALLFTFNSKFLPDLREGHYMVHTSSLPGTSLHESIRIGTKLTEQFMTISGVQSVSQWTGRAQRGADTYGSHYSEYEVRLNALSGTDQQNVLNQLRETLLSFPGISFEVNSFLTERIDETVSGYTAPLVVLLYGNDLNLLDTKAQELADVINGIEGAADIQIRSPTGMPLLQVNLNADQLNFWGVQPGQVMDALQAAYDTRVVGKTLRGVQLVDIAVTLPPSFRQQTEAISTLPIKTMDGTLITLDQVAQIKHASSRYNILHQGGRRYQAVTCKVIDKDMDTFINQLKLKTSTDIQFPADMYLEFTGSAIEQAHARNTLILNSLLAGIGVLILLYLALGSMRHVTLTLVNLPFALIGGIVAVLLTGASLSVGSVVGFITLFGITVRNTIMLLTHYRYLVDIEGKTWNLQTAREGAQDRLPSILMTALVTALAMLPIALNSDNPGREVMGPMAAIIIGGLASSTLLNLLLLPGVLLRYGRFGD
ncbi:MAG: efflux RND transporter permease subunit [Methylococcales bacterium]